MKIESYNYTGEAMARVYENEKWTIGIKNWKPGSDPGGIDCLERHNETDELFVLVRGSCVLVCAEETGAGLEFSSVEMELDTVYNIPRGLWHNAITSRNAKLIVMEDVSTGMNNSDLLSLNEEQTALVRSFWKYGTRC